MPVTNLIDLVPPVTPAMILHHLALKVERDWRIRAVFAPDLSYEAVMQNLATDPLAERDQRDGDLLDSVFAYNRTVVRNTEALGWSTQSDSWCPTQGTLDKTFVGLFDIGFKAYFSDVQTAEAFELAYMARHCLSDIAECEIVHRRPEIVEEPRSEIFRFVWSELEDVDFSLRENNYISLGFKATVDGTFRSPVLPDGDGTTLDAPKEILTVHFNTLFDSQLQLQE